MDKVARMVEPLELRVRADKRVLVVVWEGQRAELAAEYLRVESPSAEVKGHGVGQAKLVSGKREVLIQTLEPVGSYAVKIGFSDGHATGLYTWAYLRELADEQAARWACYLADLAAAGLSRDVVKPPVLRSALR